MPWPEEPEDSVIYAERELISQSDLALRMVNGSRADFWGKIYVNGVPVQSPVWTDVTAYGAVGDGVTNNTAAINAAIAALPTIGAVLYFPPGTYLFDRMSIALNNLVISGYGATLLSTQGVGSTLATISITGSDISIYGLALDHTTRPDPLQYQKQSSVHGLIVRGVANANTPRGPYCRIRDVHIRSAWFSGIVVNFCQYVNVEACTVEHLPATGLFITSNDDVTIHGNTIYETGDDGIFVGSTTNSTIPEYIVCRRVSITDNHTSKNSAKGIGTAGVLGCTIANNHIENTQGPGIRCQEETVYELGPSSQVTVTGNTLVNVGQYTGWQGSLSATAYGVHIAGGGWKLNISDNIFENTYADVILAAAGTNKDKNGRLTITGNLIDGSTTGAGIKIGVTDHTDKFAGWDLVVSNNRITGVLLNGIGILWCSYAVVNNNLIRTWGLASSGTRRAIFVDGSDIVLIQDNLMVNDAVSGATKQGIFIDPSCTSIRESGNWHYASGGSTDKGSIYSIGGRMIILGAGSPEGVYTSGVGSIFMRNDGGALTSFYVKESGTGNTGWVGK